MTAAVHFTIKARDKEVCQDAAHAFGDEHRFVLCVADGAGGSALSEWGARLAVASVAASLRRSLPYDAESLLSAIAAARVGWEQTVAAQGLPDTALDTTLGVATNVGRRWMFGAVGDAFVATISNTEAPVLRLPFSLGRDDGRAANDADVWGLPDWVDRYRCLQIWDPELFGVMLSTDGLENVAIAHGAAGEDAATTVESIGILPGTVDRLFELVRNGWDGERIADAMQRSAVVMESKGDDIGVAVATW